MGRRDDQVTPEVAEEIGHYVYVLQDPRTGAPFYVGKGVGDRVHAHVREAIGEGDSRKLSHIREIEASGLRVGHLIVRSALRDEDEAFAVEQALIDALTLTTAPLTNMVKGHGVSRHGLATVSDMIARYGALPMPPLAHRMLFVKINRHRSTDGPAEIYERTRGHWRVSGHGRAAVTHVAGVAFGVIRGVYRVDDWFESQAPGDHHRWGFNGESDPNLAHIIGTHVRNLFNVEGQQNPVRYYWPGLERNEPRPW